MFASSGKGLCCCQQCVFVSDCLLELTLTDKLPKTPDSCVFPTVCLLMQHTRDCDVDWGARSPMRMIRIHFEARAGHRGQHSLVQNKYDHSDLHIHA